MMSSLSENNRRNEMLKNFAKPAQADGSVVVSASTIEEFDARKDAVKHACEFFKLVRDYENNMSRKTADIAQRYAMANIVPIIKAREINSELFYAYADAYKVGMTPSIVLILDASLYFVDHMDEYEAE